MGQAFRKVFSIASREVKMYNIEKRAEKVISKEKPSPAPMYPSTLRELERLKEEKVSTEYLQKKDEKLDEFLKNVFVTTPDPAPSMKRVVNPERPLPLDRVTDRGQSYGYSESEEASVPAGRVSLKQALQFIADHKTDPLTHSKMAIASKYQLAPTTTDDILDHFKMLSVHVQKDKDVDPETLSTYEQLELKVKNLTTLNVAKVFKDINEVTKEENVSKEKTVNEVNLGNDSSAAKAKNDSTSDKRNTEKIDR